MVALLKKGLLEQTWSQHQVSVYTSQVEKIGPDPACHRIDGLVRIGKGIDKGLEGALGQLVEHVFQWIFFRTGQYRMFQDMGNP